MTRLAIHGASGRMGRALLRAAWRRAEIEIAAALVRPGSELDGEPLERLLGEEAPPLQFSAALDPDAGVEAIVDFSTPEGFDAALALARAHGLAFVTGTTGLDAARQSHLEAAAAHIPVLQAANFSLGVALLRKLAATAAGILDEGYDVEIVETHHRHKRDAPSGTALALGRAIADARRRRFEEIARFARHGEVGPRPSGEIGFAVLRAADVVGEHTVVFATAGERIELTHRAGSREIFARGALRAAAWLAGREPGVYDIADVLG